MTEPTTLAARARSLGALAKAVAPPLTAGVVLIGALSGWVASGGLGTIARVRLQVVDATVPVPATPGITAAYLTIRNSGADADELISVRTASAAQSMLNKNSDNGTSGEMTAIGEVEVPAHGSVTFGPFGLDIMLMNPRPLHVGQTVTLVLGFRTAGDVTVQATVTPPGTS
jgi:copper(I)-binding protein